MKHQHQIKRTLSSPENIALVRGLIEANGDLLRSHLATEVCERLGFVDARGHLQVSTCLKALRDLESQGQLELPGRKGGGGPRQLNPKRLSEAVPAPEGVPESVEQIEGLDLVLVDDEEGMRTWNELMLREHPRGSGPLVGRQVRYLVTSEHGWLGALGFGAAALHLAARDAWIGWDYEQRRDRLHRVVGLSRLLIRPQVTCRNLASHVLGRCTQRFVEDFEARYAFAPWLLETFVDAGENGTCFQAANWQWVGRTRGRGRQDRDKAAPESVKDVYVYPLVQDVRAELDLPACSGKSALPPGAGWDAEGWGQAEFGGAPVGNRRLAQRLANSAEQLAARPGQAYCSVTRGDAAAIKGYYRFIEKPDDSAVTPANILRPHRERTVRRMKSEQTVLCIQDGTSLHFPGLAQTRGLGVIGKNQTGKESPGLDMHSTLVVNTRGLPLGVLDVQFSSPPAPSEAKTPEEPKRTKKTKKTPIEDKKTYCWLLGLRTCAEVARELPHTRQVCVMDREADFFECFDEARKHHRVDVLIRAKHDRRLGGGARLFKSVRNTPVRSRLRIRVPRSSARPKKSKQKARAKREARIAEVCLRYTQVELPAPDSVPDAAPIPLSVIEIVEENPPKGVVALRWVLLLDRRIASPQDAEEYLRWYTLRWRIEDWHRVLKSGCRIERLAHRSAVRLKRAISIRLVIACRILLMTLLGREHPDLPSEVLFSDIEIKVLRSYSEQRKKKLRIRETRTN